MAPTEPELAYRAARRTLPDFRFDRDQLVHLLRALPAPPPDAPVAWRHAHLRGIIQEIRALDPRDPLESMLVMQIIAVRQAAADTARRSLDPALTARQVAQLRLNAEALSRAARRAERSLKREQARRAAGVQAPAEVAFDVEDLDAVWCRTDGLAPVPEGGPAGLPSGGDAGVGGPSPAAPRAARQQAAAPARIARAKYTLCGQRIDLVRLATIPAAGTA